MSTNREGYIYEAKEGDGYVSEDGVYVMVEDDGTYMPYFEAIKGEIYGGVAVPRYISLDRLNQIWPKPVEPVETITLFGKEYSKTEIEQALKDVKAIN